MKTVRSFAGLAQKIVFALVFLGLMAGCRSERVAFQFQSTAPETSVVYSDPPHENELSATINTELVLAKRPSPAFPLQPPKHRPTPKRPLPFVAHLLLRKVLAKQRRWHTAAAVHRRAPHDVADMYPGQFYSGIACILVGLVLLLVSLIILSGWLALVGLVVFVLGLILASIGWSGDGHWSYG